MVGLLIRICLGWALLAGGSLQAGEDDPKAGIFVEGGRLVLTRLPAPESPGDIPVWWNKEKPDRDAAAPLESFTTSVQPDDSLHLLTEINPVDFDKAFFFIGLVREFMEFTTELGDSIRARGNWAGRSGRGFDAHVGSQR